MPKLLLLFVLAVGASASLLAQRTYQLSGSVLDGENKEPLPFASVALVSKNTGQILGGTTTDDDGRFFINGDSLAVQLECSFMGFDKLVVADLPNLKGAVDLGQLVLQIRTQIGPSIEVETERSTMEFKLDKRVFNVGKDITSTGAGALDVLNNVPSVSVDIEGNVSLRGNKGVQILIDGKPSSASDDPRKALGTITADMIDRIEVISNPSAKYEAGGTAGIINIVLKKEEKNGANGSISINTGYPNNHSVGGSINYRRQKLNFFTQFGGGYRSMPNKNENSNINLRNNSRIDGEGIGQRDEAFGNITLGADYFINKYNTLTLSGNFAYEFESNPAKITTEIRDTNNELISKYIRSEETSAINPKWQYDLQYKKEFRNNKEHTLLASIQGRFFGKNQSSEFLNSYILGNFGATDQRTETDFYQADYIYKLDYTNPISNKLQIELGAMYEINDVGNNYAVYDYQNDWIINPSLTNDFQYNQKVLGSYATAAYEDKNWGLKLGLRLENTDLTTQLVNTQQQNQQNYTNLFPSAHASYKFAPHFSMQVGYSRRIMRPRLWDLNPFFNIQNTYNVRTGNPNLRPEFSDSYELTGIYIKEKYSLNASLYYLYTTQVVENISYYLDGVNLSTKDNIGLRHKFGLEVNGKYTPNKWFNLNGDLNVGYFSRQGQFDSQNFDFQAYQWSSKLTFKFKLPKGLDFELSPNYQSNIQTVQGYTKGYFFADFGLRKKLLKNKAVLSFAVRDIFASRIQETIVENSDFYLRSFSMRGRFIVLGFTYSFGKGEVMTYGGGKR